MARERYEIERAQGGYVLLVNDEVVHGPDYLAIVLGKLEARVTARHTR